MNIQEINKAISELEAGPTTFQNCDKLASLYICKQNLISKNNDSVVKEYNDILPMYYNYRNCKKQYQHDELSERLLIQAFGKMCVELSEFILMLYNSTESEQERYRLKEMFINLYDRIK